jgi:hypothetical protein
VVTGATGVPSGTVLFKDGAATLCAASLAAVGGKAQGTCTTSALAAGAHTIAASYGGSAAFGASACSLAQTVAAPKTVTATTVTSSLNPVVVGRTVTLTTTVSGAAGLATGVVTIREGTNVVCTASVAVVGNSAKAACATAALAVGSHPLVAIYSGDGKYLAATSTTFTQVVTAK